MKNKATKIDAGRWEFMGWEIEKMESGQWNMKPPGETFWTDAAATLSEAKEMIKRIEAK